MGPRQVYSVFIIRPIGRSFGASIGSLSRGLRIGFKSQLRWLLLSMRAVNEPFGLSETPIKRFRKCSDHGDCYIGFLPRKMERIPVIGASRMSPHAKSPFVLAMLQLDSSGSGS